MPEESISEILAGEINKKFKSSTGGIVGFLDGSQYHFDGDFVSTGATTLDLAIANRAGGGLPYGRIVEINGLEGSGKSLIAASTMANVQKAGGVAVYIDTESSAFPEWMTVLGVKLTGPNKLIYSSISNISEVFELAEQFIKKVRELNKDKPVCIVIDSIAAATTEEELESDYGKDGYATQKAIIISKAMRKITELIANEKILLICIQQLRERVGGMGRGDKYTTSGGYGLRYHASVRLRVSRIAKITDSAKNVLGTTVNVEVIKNRMGPPWKKATFNIYFKSGIDETESLMDVLVSLGISSKKSPQTHVFENSDTGEEISYTKKTFKAKMLDEPDNYSNMYSQLVNAYITPYEIDDTGDIQYQPEDE